MKNFLQIQKAGILIPPKILEMGVDFDEIHHFNAEKNRRADTELNLRNGINVAYLEDCFQSRPLIEIDGFGEFNVYLHNDCEDDTQDAKMVIYEKIKSRFIFQQHLILLYIIY